MLFYCVKCNAPLLKPTWDDRSKAILLLVLFCEPLVECPPVFIDGESLNCKTKTVHHSAKERSTVPSIYTNKM